MKTLPQHLLNNYNAILTAGTARSTRRAYERDVRAFFTWTQATYQQGEHFPVDETTVIAFILDQVATLRVTTLRRYLASLSVAHQQQGLISPTQAPAVKLLLRRAQVTQSGWPSNKKAAITQSVLNALLAACDDSLRGIRDRALLLVGFGAGGRRRDELSRLRVEHLTTIDGGYLLHLPSSKTDQVGQGHTVALLGQPAHALRTWLLRADVTQGYVFRGIRNNGQLNDSLCGRSINAVVKRHARRAGFDEGRFGAHSLRAGFITEASARGIPLAETMQLSGHKNLNVAQRYIREGQLLANRALHLAD